MMRKGAYSALLTLTDDETSRLRAYIERGRLVCVLNDTKWRRLREALAPIGVRYRRKDLREPEPARDDWQGDDVFAGHPASFEWIEVETLRPVHQGPLATPRFDDLAPAVEAALRANSIPFMRERDRVRVWGYLRPGSSPQWA